MSEKEKRVIPRRLDEIVVPASIFLDRLTDFLGNSDGQTTEEVKAELREQGIDVDSFLSEAKAKIKVYIKEAIDMNDDVLGFLREARAALNDECEQYPRTGKTRELSIVITKIDEAILWRQEDLRKKRPIENGQPA